MDLSQTIIPKSDQLNADDLIAGPLTIRITAVSKGSKDQPVIIAYEGDNGRPYKPCKSMRRVLVALYGRNSDEYISKRITLYNDPEVCFGGVRVGGIRISHASGIDRTFVMALTLKQNKRAEYRVDVLPPERAPEPVRDMQTLCDIGDAKAAEGVQSLRSWWESLSKDERTALGTTRINEWKERAS